MCYSHPGRSLTSCLFLQCVHSVCLRQLNKLKAIIKLIIALQEMKNADIKAKNSLSYEVSDTFHQLGFFGAIPNSMKILGLEPRKVRTR